LCVFLFVSSTVVVFVVVILLLLKKVLRIPRALKKVLRSRNGPQNGRPQDNPTQVSKQDAQRSMHSDGNGIKVGQVVKGVFPPKTQSTRPKVGLKQGAHTQKG
jgi:hypothetical protein